MRPTRIAFATTTVKVHTGPGTSYPQVAGLPKLMPGQVVTVLAQLSEPGQSPSDWTHVQDADTGLAGYAATEYLDIQSAASPLFLPDVYWQDAGGQPNWRSLFLDPRCCGAILKATQGTSVPSGESSWFQSQWAALREAGGDAYGASWFRGVYHFLMLVPPPGQTPQAFGQAQADYYLEALHGVGGLQSGDLPPIVDVENNSGSGNQSSLTIVEEIATAWAEAVQAGTGRKVMMYRRYTDSDWPGLVSTMGCAYLWAKRYATALGTIANGFTSAALWQYTDGSSNVPSDLPSVSGGPAYPYDLPGLGPIDASTVVYGDGTASAVLALINDSAVKDSTQTA